MRSNLVRGSFAQNGPGGHDIPLSPPDPQKPVIREFLENLGRTTQRCQSRKVAQHGRGSDEPKLPGGAELRPKWFFVGSVPTLHSGSPTGEMVPRHPQSTRILGPRDTQEPKQGSVGPHSACDHIWSPGVSPRTAPKTGKTHFLAFLVRFRPRTGPRNFSPRPPKTSKLRIAAAGGRTIKSAK